MHHLEGFEIIVSGGMSSSKLRAAAAAALGAAAVKARIMAESEEREALRLTQQLIEIQHRKLTTKLRTFEQMEEALLKEKGVMEVCTFPVHVLVIPQWSDRKEQFISVAKMNQCVLLLLCARIPALVGGEEG